MVLGRDSVNKDIEAAVWVAGAPCKVSMGARDVTKFPETEGSPEGGCTEGDVAPVLADVGGSKLKLG